MKHGSFWPTHLGFAFSDAARHTRGFQFDGVDLDEMEIIHDQGASQLAGGGVASNQAKCALKFNVTTLESSN